SVRDGRLCVQAAECQGGVVTGGDYSEKRTERLAQRNGDRKRDWETRADTIELWIAQIRKGGNFLALHEPPRLAEKALTAGTQPAYIRASQPGPCTNWSKPWP